MPHAVATPTSTCFRVVSSLPRWDSAEAQAAVQQQRREHFSELQPEPPASTVTSSEVTPIFSSGLLTQA
ncbi:hypothetical protein INR49_001717 [Caranx melampygus]|nr:hypothetical protein INR49_001717 [Caranx melampygus]